MWGHADSLLKYRRQGASVCPVLEEVRLICLFASPRQTLCPLCIDRRFRSSPEILGQYQTTPDLGRNMHHSCQAHSTHRPRTQPLPPSLDYRTRTLFIGLFFEVQSTIWTSRASSSSCVEARLLCFQQQEAPSTTREHAFLGHAQVTHTC